MQHEKITRIEYRVMISARAGSKMSILIQLSDKRRELFIDIKVIAFFLQCLLNGVEAISLNTNKGKTYLYAILSYAYVVEISVHVLIISPSVKLLSCALFMYDWMFACFCSLTGNYKSVLFFSC